MTPEELTERRKAMDFTQTEMASILGMSLRGYRKLESGEVPIKTVYGLATNYVGLLIANSTRNINAAPAGARNLALAVAELIRGK